MEGGEVAQVTPQPTPPPTAGERAPPQQHPHPTYEHTPSSGVPALALLSQIEAEEAQQTLDEAALLYARHFASRPAGRRTTPRPHPTPHTSVV